MISTVFACATLMVLNAGQELGASEFARVMKGLHAEIRDVTFVYEGGMQAADQSGSRPLGGSHQGLYTFRSDGATLLDVFTKPSRGDKPGSRSIFAILNGKLETSRETDMGYSKPVVTGGAPGSLNRPNSPERIFYLWYLQSLRDPEAMGYEFQGWEDIGGHRCLRVQLYTIPVAQLGQAKGSGPTIRLWIDLERGGHPLQVEFYTGQTLKMRAENIELGQVSLPDGKSIWLPVRGEMVDVGNSKLKDINGKAKIMGFKETYAVVDGSVKINQGLDDTYFTVRRKGARFESAELSRLQRDLDASRRAPLRTDPQGVRERLDRKLAEAARQSELLDASAAKGPWTGTTILQLGLCVVGALLVGGAIIWKRSHP